MAHTKFSKFRLAINAIGCLFIVVLFLPSGIVGLFGLISGALGFGRDPDGGDKVLAISLLSGFVGALALVSLVRSVKAWRAMSDGAPDGADRPAKAATASRRRWVLGSLAVLFGGYVLYLGYFFSTAESRIRGVCAEIRVGTAVQALQAFASAHGLEPMPVLKPDGAAYLLESQSFGRHGCHVSLSAGAVTSVQYHFAD